MDNQVYLRECEKIAFLLREMFKKWGVQTDFEYKKRVDPEYIVHEYTTEPDVILGYNSAQYSVYFFENSKRMIVDVTVGYYSDRLEMRKIFETEDTEKNLDFIKETVYQWYLNFNNERGVKIVV